MSQIGQYSLEESIGKSGKYTFHNAVHIVNKSPCIIKVLRHETNANNEKNLFQYEFELLTRLEPLSPYLPKVAKYVATEEMSGLVYQETGYVSLAEIFPQKKLPQKEFFSIALELTKTLNEIHKTGLIFKNLNFDTIFYNTETKKIKLFDYSIASELKNIIVPITSPELLQGNLYFIAPEQTGHLNRSISKRTDLYSLGVVFYLLLTGQLPYQESDPLQLLLAHITTPPKNPMELDDKIPEQICLMVMKLLEKFPDDRYRNAEGVLEDLKQCKEELDLNAKIPLFTLDQHKVFLDFSFPEKLYGHEAEKKLLYGLFNSVVSTKKSEVLVIHGYSGIGKTSFVFEVISMLPPDSALFATGDFHQQESLIPYEGLHKALNQILQYITSLPQEQQEEYKQSIQNEVGVLLSVIEDFLPKIRTLVGESTPLPSVGIEETKNRFELAVMQFIKALSKKIPLIIFLDDIHWADAPMLSLLKRILTTEEIQNVFFILSYRSNNLNHTQPLFECLTAVKKEKNISEIEFHGLDKVTITDILHNSLSLPRDEVYNLALLLEKKTQGNPFFLRTLLDSLYESGILYFSEKEYLWHWDEDKIEAMPVMENVANYVNQRIENLPPDIKDVLHVAACIGNTFTPGEIASTGLYENEKILNAIELAIKKDIIVPLKSSDEFLFSVGIWDKDHLFSFHHNNIQNACYQLKNVEESTEVHLILGRILYRQELESSDISNLLALTNQYNKGSSKITDMEERKILCELNNKASQTAMKSAAYGQAYLYDKNAVEMLEKTNLFQENYSLAFDMYFNYIKSSFLAKKFDLSHEISEKVLGFSKNNFDKARIYALKGNLGRVMGVNKDYTAYFEEGLRILGYPMLAMKPSIMNVVTAVLRFKLKLLSQQPPLQSLPSTKNPEHDLTYSLVERIAEECYFEANILRYVYIVTTWSYLTYHLHNRELRSAFYSANGVLWPLSKASYRYCVEAFNYTSHAPVNEVCAVTAFVINVLNFSWHIPWKNVVANAKRCALQLEQIGNFELYAYSLISACYYDLSQACNKSSVTFEHLGNLTKNISPRAWPTAVAHWQFYRNMGAECAFDTWTDSVFNEQSVIHFCEEHGYKAPITYLYYSKLRFAAHGGTLLSRITERNYLFNELSEILHRNNVFDSLNTILFIFLCDIQRYSQLSFLEKVKANRGLSRIYKIIRSWEKLTPQNFKHFVTLLEAELARKKGNAKKAVALYKACITQSEKVDALEYIGFSQQRLATLELEQGHPQEATVHLRAAIETYENWHAYGISRHLEEVHKDLLRS